MSPHKLNNNQMVHRAIPLEEHRIDTNRQESERFISSSSEDPETRNRTGNVGYRRSVKDKLSYIGLGILIVGSVILLASLSFLSFLWWSSPGISSKSPSAAWLRIVLNGWLPQAISLSALVIRLVISTQGAFCTAVVASLLLEHAGVSIAHVPQVLALRSFWTGPHNLLLWKAKTLNSITYTVLALMLLGMGSLSQFASTLLLSDLKPGQVQNSTVLDAVPLAALNGDFSNTVEMGTTVAPWLNSFPSYPLFAEYTEPPGPRGHEYDDTGQTLRAFLPFQDSSTRSSLHSYTGYATVVQMRFVCVAPETLQFNITPSMLGVDLDTAHSWFSFLNNVSAPDGIGFLAPEASPGSPLLETATIVSNCSVRFPGPFTNFATVCAPLNISHGVSGPTTIPYLEALLDTQDEMYSGKFQGTQFMVLNMINKSNMSLYSYPLAHNWTMIKQEGPWTYIQMAGLPPIQISLCFTNMMADLISTQLENGPGYIEPTISYSATAQAYNTTGVVNLLAGNRFNMSLQRRGVLELQKTNWTASEFSNITIQTSYQDFSYTMMDQLWATGIPDRQAKSMTICVTDCLLADPLGDNLYEFFAHRTLAAIFNDVIAQTGSLAAALQSLFTLMYQSLYYDVFPDFDFESQAKASFLVTTLIPSRLQGLIIIWVTALVHLLAVVTTITIFCSKKQLALLGNYWQSFAQTRTGEIGDVMALASTESDKMVKKHLDKNDMKDIVCQIIYNSETETLEIRRKRKRE